jgi:hypothetical protein
VGSEAGASEALGTFAGPGVDAAVRFAVGESAGAGSVGEPVGNGVGPEVGASVGFRAGACVGEDVGGGDVAGAEANVGDGVDPRGLMLASGLKQALVSGKWWDQESALTLVPEQWVQWSDLAWVQEQARTSDCEWGLVLEQTLLGALQVELEQASLAASPSHSQQTTCSPLMPKVRRCKSCCGAGSTRL